MEQAQESLDFVRRDFLKKLSEYTGRNVIAYYSGFLSKPSTGGLHISHEDMNGLMTTVHQLDRKKGLDLILHTPGGEISATIAIVRYLRTQFDSDIRTIIPQIAMSAGTMIACSSREIMMAKHSCIGPTDPQFGRIPAAGVKIEFERAVKECRKDPSRILVWQNIIGKYQPTFLSQCDNAVKQAKLFVQTELETNMFAQISPAKKRQAAARKVVKHLTDYTRNKSHDRPIMVDEAMKIGLNVTRIETDQQFQDLVLSAHHCYMHSFMNSSANKIIENMRGIALVKNAGIEPKK